MLEKIRIGNFFFLMHSEKKMLPEAVVPCVCYGYIHSILAQTLVFMFNLKTNTLKVSFKFLGDAHQH